MNIICAILTGLHYLAERAEKWIKRAKISKKSRREQAVFLVGAVAVAVAAFSSRGVHAQGRNQDKVSESREISDGYAQEPEEELIWGLDSIIQSVVASQDTESEIQMLGTSFEVILVGQRIGKREIESHLDFAAEGPQNMEMLQDKSIGISESQLSMTDEDYETLLKIVEAEAGGEDIEGKILVANVIFNRVESPQFPSNVTDVVWQNEAGSPQFSPTVDGRIYTVTVSEETREAVNRTIEGEDISKGALFFVEESYADKENVEWFKKNLKFLFKHGAHTFYTFP